MPDATSPFGLFWPVAVRQFEVLARACCPAFSSNIQLLILEFETKLEPFCYRLPDSYALSRRGRLLLLLLRELDNHRGVIDRATSLLCFVLACSEGTRYSASRCVRALLSLAALCYIL